MTPWSRVGSDSEFCGWQLGIWAQLASVGRKQLAESIAEVSWRSCGISAMQRDVGLKQLQRLTADAAATEVW